MNKFHNNGVSLADYQVDGHGEHTTKDVELLMKALEAGSITGGASKDLTDASGAPLKVESLENTLKVLTFQEKDIVLWKRIPNLPAYNTVEEFNQLVDYGSDAGGFNLEGELPDEDDSTYVRKAELVKFMGTTRVVTHPMQLVSTMVGNVVQQEIKNGTLWLLRKLDRALTFGNSDVVPQEFNGILKQQENAFATFDDWHESDNVIDAGGSILTEALTEQASLVIEENYGSADLLMAPPKVLSMFATQFHDSKLIQPNTPAQTNMTAGQYVQGFLSQFGPVDMGYDKFMKRYSVPKKIGAAAIGKKAPASPVADATTPKAASSDTKGFNATHAGDYFFAVSAINRHGESALTDLSTAGSPAAKLTLAANKSAALKFTAGSNGNPTTGYIIYRSKKNPSTALADTPLYPVLYVSTADLANGYDGGAAGIINDRNKILSGTDIAFMIQGDQEVYSFKQLAPLMKMDLAIISPATRFMLLLYGTPMLYAQKKMVMIKNIGTTIS